MVKELSEQEFIERFSEELYLKTVMNVFERMKEFPEWKTQGKTMLSFMVLPCKSSNGVEFSLIVESKVNRTMDYYTKEWRAYDFGFTRLYITDEMMPDLALDRYNEYKKAKELT